MNRDDEKSTFSYDNDPEFASFYKNLDKVLDEAATDTEKHTDIEQTLDEAAKAPAPAENIHDKREITTKETGNVRKTSENADGAISDVNASYFTPVINTNDKFEEVEDQLTDINASLAKQIRDEIDSTNTKGKRKKRRKKVLIGLLIGILCIAAISSFLIFTKPGNRFLMKIGINLGGQLWDTMTKSFGTEGKVKDADYLEEDDIKSKAPEIDPSKIKWPEHPGDGVHMDGVYNILLLGEEAIGMGDSRGRTDVIVIATLNTNDKKVKLTSLMRDTLVQIPGYRDNKLNSAYEKGGIDLLYQTIALNFNIRLDGCAKVNFKNFEKIINMLGGLDLTLTADEAQYLNTTNYISKKKYRTVKEGFQHMNGNQVLGYARVRKRATITGNNNDYGRTDRHRIVLNAIYEKYKTKSKVELAQLMFRILPMITTDIDSDCFEMLLNSFMKMNTTKVEQLRIPANGTFTDNVKVRGMAVLIPDLNKNIDVLHKFIFGKNTTVGKTDHNYSYDKNTAANNAATNNATTNKKDSQSQSNKSVTIHNTDNKSASETSPSAIVKTN